MVLPRPNDIQLGAIASRNPSNEERSQLAIKHFKRARAIYNLLDMTNEARQMDFVIPKLIDDKQAATNDGDIPSSTRTSSDTDLEFARNEYESNLNTHGIESIATIKGGVMYAAMLTIVKRRIEAQLLVTKLATISRTRPWTRTQYCSRGR
jgi:putative lipase involved disintegration of autophagic bodies